ncbi:MAG: bdbD [Candidatus Saccharibacteria bacterium]|nr:bdbD [Candidatus Saccharibacteria bacterium]
MSELTVPVTKNDHFQGPADAPVTMVEYGDYECPYCGQAYYIIKQLQADLGDMLRFVFRNFPLTQIHPDALPAAYAAEAAGLQGKFWEMHDVIYEHQEELEAHNLASFAYLLELDVDRFVKDMNSEAVNKKVYDDFWSGVRSGVNGTPTFFINGKRHEGSYAYQSLRGAIEEAAGQAAKGNKKAEGAGI